MSGIDEKIPFEGVLLSVQVRSEVWRFRAKKRSRRVTGYNLFLNAKAGNKEGRWSIAPGA